MRVWKLIGVCAAALALAGCVPPKLMDSPNAGSNNGTGGGGDGGGGGGGGTNNGNSGQPTFHDVANLVRASCSTASTCHGAASTTNFKVQGDSAATDAQVKAALDGVTALRDQIPLVTPGDPSNSDFFTRLSAQEPLLMPPTGKLTDAQITMVKTWIEQGASYE